MIKVLEQLRIRGVAALAACGLVVLSACDAGNSSTSFDSGPIFAVAGADSGLLAKIASAPQRAIYLGTRVHLDFQAGIQTQYREQVAGNGAGQFALDLVDWIEPQLSGSEAALTAQLVALRAGLYYRYRGFAIRTLPSFFANFTVADVTDDVPTGSITSTTVAGIEGVALHVAFADPQVDARHWELVVEPGTGLILESMEFASDQTLVAHTWFESLDLDPDLSGVAWHVPTNQESDVSQNDAPSVFTWPQLSPAYVPAGYQQSELASLVSEDGRLWAKRTYTNGVDVMFFLEAEPIVGQAVKPDDEVFSFQVDAWSALDGEVQGHRVIALGRMTEIELALVLQSGLE